MDLLRWAIVVAAILIMVIAVVLSERLIQDGFSRLRDRASARSRR